MKKVQLTQEGLEKLHKEDKELKTVKRPTAIERLQKARAMGDLSENSEYTAAKEELAFVEERIQEIEEILRNAQVITNHNTKNEVSLGSKVIVEVEGEKEEFYIVGEFEADPMQKKLSHTSPIGQALMGKTAGQTVDVKVPAGQIKYKILEIK